jgi:gluconate 2-dehydrogenase gamma chain
MVTRRRMFSGVLGWGGAAFLAGCGKKDRPPSRQADDPEHGLSVNDQEHGLSVNDQEHDLSVDNWTALQAAIERVLPGANQAGVPAHLRYWLRARPFAAVRHEFKIGAVVLDRLAGSAHNRIFAACAPEQQDALLKMFEHGEVKERGFDGQGFFQRLLTLTLEGFLADPKYGGNRDQVGWRFIGYEPCWWAPRPK